MPGLHGFAGMQVDREQGRQQAAWSELRFGKSQRQRMDRKLGEKRRLRQQRIHPIGLQALEIVAAGEVTLKIRRQRDAYFGDTVRRKNTFEDKVAAGIELFPPRCECSSLQPGRRLLDCCWHWLALPIKQIV